jgi:hypothetical protein
VAEIGVAIFAWVAQRMRLIVFDNFYDFANAIQIGIGGLLERFPAAADNNTTHSLIAN